MRDPKQAGRKKAVSRPTTVPRFFKLRLAMKAKDPDAEYEAFADYVLDCYPTDGSHHPDTDAWDDDRMTMLFYTSDPDVITNWFKESAPDLGFRLARTSQSPVPSRAWPSILKRLT